MQLLGQFADASAGAQVVRDGLMPILSAITTVAGAAFVLFLIIAGIYYITSAGNVQRLQQAKDILIKGTVGFVIVLGASTFSLTMQTTYNQKPEQPQQISNVNFGEQKQEDESIGNQMIMDLIRSAVNSVGKPITEVISNFLTQTPLMSQTPKVFNLWTAVLYICIALFVLVIILSGFRVMSASIFGFEEGEIRQLFWQIAGAFLVMNLSIWLIDFLILIANLMTKGIMWGSDNQVLVTAIGAILAGASTVPIGGLILILIMVILAVMLAVYYLSRIVTLYVGAVLSPLIVLLWLIPSYRDFAVMAAKQYVMTIFILFPHLIIVILASALIEGVAGSNPFISALLGITTFLVLLKTNSVVSQTITAAGTIRGMRRLGTSFASSSRNFASTVKEKSGQSTQTNRETTKPVLAGATPGGGSVSTGTGSGKFKNYSSPKEKGGAVASPNNLTTKGLKEKPQVNVRRVPAIKNALEGNNGASKFKNDSKSK